MIGEMALRRDEVSDAVVVKKLEEMLEELQGLWNVQTRLEMSARKAEYTRDTWKHILEEHKVGHVEESAREETPAERRGTAGCPEEQILRVEECEKEDAWKWEHHCRRSRTISGDCKSTREKSVLNKDIQDDLERRRTQRRAGDEGRTYQRECNNSLEK
ncbi:hypothetical protein KI387_039807, partial [Taxus chinensis]